MTVEKTNLAAVAKWAELYNLDPHRMIDECYAVDAEITAPEELHITDRESFHAMEAAAREAMPDRHCEVLSTAAIGDQAFIEGVMTGTSPVGKALKVHWASVLTFRDGLIVTDRTYMDWWVFKDFPGTAEYRDPDAGTDPSATRRPADGDTTSGDAMTAADPLPSTADISAFYDVASQVLSELWDESFHAGYWESEDDDSSNKVAADRMTDVMIGLLAPADGTEILDVGCGIGTPAFRLAGAARATIRGISINKAQVIEANRRADERGLADRVSFDHGDALAMPYADASYDAAWAFESLIHMDRPAALREIGRVLKPGAPLVVADLLQTGPLADEDQALVRDGLRRMSASPMLTEAEYRSLVADSGFELVEFRDVSAHTTKMATRMLEATDRRYDEMAGRFGPEAVELMDLIRSPAAQLSEMGYLLAVLRKPL
ncbi:methyltransferase domain-containing protein [Wenjunlia tyrosinilytica]|uniref:Uncharacterized protein n=1 Tax=Wenjunlia tyrosinilytica TaxID=1544741 RepID=A0A917ZY91_9ACTN|nr:methyltransferase domain-containing protein [Wenjunlia tyrosinilytica]GGP00446.1 hypothetical protein GCM10012280_69230 [Wenjunlia tyrosinilytica]